MTVDSPATVGALLIAPGDRFFVLPVPLDAGAAPSAQVELALEEASPFPLAQMYHGFVVSPDRSQALAYASYRRRFPPEEQAAWPAAAAVVPSFLALLGPAPAAPQVVIHAAAGILQGIAWDGRAPLPVAVLAQAVAEPTDAQAEAFAAELQRLGGLAGAEVRRLGGAVTVTRDDDDEDARFLVDGAETARLPAAAVADADVRDKSFLVEKQLLEQRDRAWWRGALGVAALLLLALGLEVAGVGISLWSRRDAAVVARRADEVARIENAQTMALRIEHLSARQQRPLEWLAQASAVRPRSIQFIRAIGHNDRTIEIEAQTANANDVGNYEAALRKVPGLAKAETRDLRAREGVTTFVVALTFASGPEATP